MRIRIGQSELVLKQGDITKEEVDAIVNAANSSLLGGGGVDGAIHRAGGPAILEECSQIRARQGPCPPGKAVVTTAGKLKAKWVIHAVGPVWRGGHQHEDELLRSAYKESLRLAEEKGAETVAFPAISTGAYRFPLERAARISLDAVRDFLFRHPGRIREVRFVLYNQEALSAFSSALNELSAKIDE
jgi:O-acetyl-ADP-ribose deacetylase (regulator of RNase III)